MNSLNGFKIATGNLCQMKGWDRVPVHVIWMLFTEEVGELASAIRQHQKIFKKNMKKDSGTDLIQEFGDVFSYLFQLAFMFNIDLDLMWWHHYQKASAKIYGPVLYGEQPGMFNGESSGKRPLLLRQGRGPQESYNVDGNVS